MPVLKVSNLIKTFSSGIFPFTKKKSYTAVDNISFTLNKGEILGLLGPNGAGKTTTIQMLLGTLTPTSGSIHYFDRDFTHNRIALLNKIGYASGYDKLPARLTVAENLDIIGRIYNIPSLIRTKRIKELLEFFQIGELHNKQTGTLSAGQATRVMLAKTFINVPEIVLLDEPTASLDPDIAHQVRKFILTQSKELNTAILITSHNMDEVTELCDRVLVLKNGKFIADNTPEELARSVSRTRIHLTISQGLDNALTYTKNEHLIHTREDNYLTIELDEQNIAPFLLQLSERKVVYSHISINKPTLEDYFLSIISDAQVLKNTGKKYD